MAIIAGLAIITGCLALILLLLIFYIAYKDAKHQSTTRCTVLNIIRDIIEYCSYENEDNETSGHQLVPKI